MAIPGNFLSQVTESIDPNTSGWTPLLNCTLSKGTGGRNGDGVLTVKSVAAGEMRARTVSSYAVTPGTVYQVFADASGSIVEKIGLRWLTAANVEVSITWSLTTAAASASLHRVGVAGPAPIGATRVQVVLSSSPAAGAVNHLWENVYLGLPIRSTGNLLPFGTESFEIDASGWTSELNATVSRSAPAVQWPVTWYYSGGAILTVTAIANGDVAARTVERPVVTEGVEYTAYCYLSPPTTGSDTWIEIRFYDATDTQLTATRGELAAASTGYQRQRVSAVAPAGAVTCGVTVGMDGATAAQILRVEQVVVTVTPGFQAGSVVRYADASFEQGVAGWTKTSGVATIARSTPWGAAAADGSYCLTVTSATATASTIRSGKFPLPAGSDGADFRLSFYEQVTAGSWTTTRGVRWYDAADTDLGATGTGASAAPSPGWWKLSRDQTAPAGATQAAVELTLAAGAINSVIRLDAVALWQAEPLMEVDVIPASASITITLRELTLDRFLLIYRITPDGTRTLVRGPGGLYDGTVVITTDEMVIEDYEAPLLTPVYYYVEVIDPADLSHQNRTSDPPVTIPHDDPSYCWIKDPGSPQRNLRVMAVTAPDWQRVIQQGEHRVIGRRNSVILSDVRGGRDGTLTLRTYSDEERRHLHWILDSGHTLLLQFAPGLGFEDQYVAVGEVVEGRVTAYGGDPKRLWTLPLREQDMPVTTGVSGSAGRTWQDILSEFATWQEVLETYATWEDVFLDRRIGG